MRYDKEKPGWNRDWETDNIPDDDECLTTDCHHPFCVDHEVRDFWDKKDWPVMGDPWWDGLQSQTEYRRMMHYFDVRGRTFTW